MLVCAPTGAGKTVVGRVRGLPRAGHRREVFLHHADQGAVEPEVLRSGRRVRPGQSRSADRRHVDQLACRRGGDDDRGAPQHALRGLARPRRSDRRGDGRDPLPGRQVPRRGLGGSHPAPAGQRAGGRAVGHRLQRRGVRCLAADRARPHHRRGRRAPPGAALAAHAGRPPAVRPVQHLERRISTRPGRAPGSRSSRPWPRRSPTPKAWPTGSAADGAATAETAAAGPDSAATTADHGGGRRPAST